MPCPSCGADDSFDQISVDELLDAVAEGVLDPSDFEAASAYADQGYLMCNSCGEYFDPSEG